MVTHLRGGTYYDTSSKTVVENPGIVIDGQNIVHIGKYDSGRADNVIDVKGTAIPGLVNLHEHLTFRATVGPPEEIILADQNDQVIRSQRNAHLSLAQGITTVRELGARYGIGYSFRRAIQTGRAIGPRMFVAGAPLAITGGHAWSLSSEVDGEWALRRAVRQLAKEGADWVKVMASEDPIEGHGHEHTRPEYSASELEAIGEEAHQRGLKVTAHAMGEEAIRRCLNAGFDSLEHAVYLTKELAKQAVDQNCWIIPTISSYRRTNDAVLNRGATWVRLHRHLIPAHTKSTELAISEGVNIGIGTDSAGTYLEELELLVELGMDVATVLRASTLGGTEALGQQERIGSIEVGKAADIVIVDGNPIADLKAISRIIVTIKEGAIYKPSDFRASLTTTDLPRDWI